MLHDTRAVACAPGLPPDVEASALAAGFVVTSDAPVLLAAAPGERRLTVAIVADRASADAAVDAGAIDALVWPAEQERLRASLVAATRHASHWIGHQVYREAFRASPDWREIATDDIVLADVSRGFEEATGYGRDEAIGRTPASLFRGGTHGPAFYEGVVRALHERGAWSGDTLARRRDGSLAVVELSIGTVVVGGRGWHFTTRRGTRSGEACGLRGWIDTATSAPWWLMRLEDTTIVEVGGPTQRLPWPRGSLVGQRAHTLLPQLLLPTDGDVTTLDLWIGSQAFEVRCHPRRLGDVAMALVVFVDITDRKRHTEALDALTQSLAAARDHALAADRAKSAFLAAMSHDLRTPLTAIIGYAELLEEGPCTDEARRDLQRILGSGRHLLGLVDDVLDLARIESGALVVQREPVQVREVLEELAHSFARRADACGQRIVIVGTGAVWDTDRQRLRQVLGNLLGNAVKYADPGEIRLVLTERTVAVEDDGPGITEQEQRRIFEPFTRLQQGGEGVGLGLSIVRRLVDALGARLSMTSDAGRGTRFEVSFAPAEA